MRKIAALLLLFSLNSNAQYTKGGAMTGNDLLKYCASIDSPRLSDDEATDVMTCLAFIEGVTDGANIDAAFRSQKPAKLFCVPNGVNRAQVSRVIVKFLKENPDKSHLSGGVAVIAALAQAFPCEK